MKVALIFPNSKFTGEAGYQLGLASINAYLTANGYQSKLFTYSSSRDLLEITEYNPDVLGIYTSEVSLRDVRILLDNVNAYSILGGPYPTIYPECLNELEADCIFRGDGEFQLLRFLESGLEDKALKGFVFRDRDNGINDRLTKIQLDSLPNPSRNGITDRHLKYDRSIRWESSERGAIHFSAGRGCPYSCNFCSNSAYNELMGVNTVFRDPEDIIAEIVEVASQYTFGTVVFTDDIMTLDANWFGRLLELYRRNVKQSLILNTRIECITKEQLKDIATTNCVLMRAGIESGNTRVRECMNRPMVTEDIYEVFCHMVDAGLRTASYNMIGYPTETLDEFNDTFDLNIKILKYANGSHIACLNTFYPYKGTPAGNLCYTNNWVIDSIGDIQPHRDYCLDYEYMSLADVQQARERWCFNSDG